MYGVDGRVHIPPEEIELSAVRAQGPGGQNVNKVASAVHLRFDVRASSLPDHVKERLLALRDHRVSPHGVINIKAQDHRSQERNREAALARLAELVGRAMATRKGRIATRPSGAARARRLEQKEQRGRLKASRGRVRDED